MLPALSLGVEIGSMKLEGLGVAMALRDRKTRA